MSYDSITRKEYKFSGANPTEVCNHVNRAVRPSFGSFKPSAPIPPHANPTTLLNRTPTTHTLPHTRTQMGLCYTVQTATCGNGLLEPGEDCDDNSGCCDPVTCKLKAGAMCSPGPYCVCCFCPCGSHQLPRWWLTVYSHHAPDPKQASTTSAAAGTAPSFRPSRAATCPVGPRLGTASTAIVASTASPRPTLTWRAVPPRRRTRARSTSATTRAHAPTRTRASSSRVRACLPCMGVHGHTYIRMCVDV